MQMRLSARAFLPAVVLFILAGAVSAYAQTPPAWLTDLNAVYPDSTYLAAQGSGDTRKDAESDAADALSRIFNVKVTVNTTAQKRYMEIASQNKNLSESESTLVQNVGMSSDSQFTNLRYSDAFTDKKGKVYVVAYLERAKTAEIYRSILRKDIDFVAGLKDRAAKEEGVLYKFALLDTAVQVSLNSDRMLGQLQIIHAPTYKLYSQEVDTAGLSALRDAAAKKVTCAIKIDGDEGGKIASIVRKKLSTLKFAVKNDGALAVNGTWTMEPIQVNPRFKSVRWTLSLALADETGAEIVTYFKEYRENAVSEAEAKAFAYRSVEKMVGDDFIQNINDYMTRITQAK